MLLGTTLAGSAGAGGGGSALFAGLGAPLASGLGSGLGQAFGGAGSGPAISSTAPNVFNDRNYINIAPVGVNAGEILRNWEGDPTNGGYGYSAPSRAVPNGGGVNVSLPGIGEAGFNVAPIALAAVGGIAIVYVIMQRRR